MDRRAGRSKRGKKKGRKHREVFFGFFFPKRNQKGQGWIPDSMKRSWVRAAARSQRGRGFSLGGLFGAMKKDAKREGAMLFPRSQSSFGKKRVKQRGGWGIGGWISEKAAQLHRDGF